MDILFLCYIFIIISRRYDDVRVIIYSRTLLHNIVLLRFEVCGPFKSVAFRACVRMNIYVVVGKSTYADR